MTAGQFAEWEAYDRIDPIGGFRDDFRIASLQAFIQNIVTALYGKEKSNRKQATPFDFMPDWADEYNREPEKMTPEQMKEAFMQLAKAHNEKRVLKTRDNIAKTKKK